MVFSEKTNLKRCARNLVSGIVKFVRAKVKPDNIRQKNWAYIIKNDKETCDLHNHQELQLEFDPVALIAQAEVFNLLNRSKGVLHISLDT